MFSHRLHLDLTTISSSYELLKSNFIFAFAESEERREGINLESCLLSTTPLPSAALQKEPVPRRLTGNQQLSQEKKALCPLCCSRSLVAWN